MSDPDMTQRSTKGSSGPADPQVLKPFDHMLCEPRIRTGEFVLDHLNASCVSSSTTRLRKHEFEEVATIRTRPG